MAQDDADGDEAAPPMPMKRKGKRKKMKSHVKRLAQKLMF